MPYPLGFHAGVIEAPNFRSAVLLQGAQHRHVWDIGRMNMSNTPTTGFPRGGSSYHCWEQGRGRRTWYAGGMNPYSADYTSSRSKGSKAPPDGYNSTDLYQ